jgi:polyphosphate kinase
MCVIERIEGGKVKRYGFISTGNFNEATARYILMSHYLQAISKF